MTPPVPGPFSWQQYRFCPRCGAEYRRADFHAASTSFRCAACMYEFFQNSSPATTAVLPRRMGSADIVLLTRSNQPGEGLLALPGGFLQYHERPIDAVRREVREEIDIDVEVDRLLETYLVDYRFRGAIVSVMELVFLCKAIDMNVGAIRSSEATAVGYYDLREVLQSPSQLAFPEQEQALRQYLCHAGL